MIEEALKARTELHAEMVEAVKGGRVDGEWLKDRADALAYYNELLGRLGFTN